MLSYRYPHLHASQEPTLCPSKIYVIAAALAIFVSTRRGRRTMDICCPIHAVYHVSHIRGQPTSQLYTAIRTRNHRLSDPASLGSGGCFVHIYLKDSSVCPRLPAVSLSRRSVTLSQTPVPLARQLSDRMETFPTSLAGEVERGLEAGQFPGPDSAASLGGTPDFIQFGERPVLVTQRSRANPSACLPQTRRT